MLRFTNVDKVDFQGELGSVYTVVPAGQFLDVEDGVAKFFAHQLAGKIQMRETDDFAQNPFRNALEESMVSEIPEPAAPPEPVAPPVEPPPPVPPVAPVVSPVPPAVEPVPVVPEKPADPPAPTPNS